MSQSLADDGGSELEGTGSTDEQLEAEIADHLAAATHALKQSGESEEQAARLALARFGDVTQIKRQCWWIHNKESAMIRAAGLALLTLLTAGVGLVGFGGWQLQRSLASRTEELSEQLASLTTTQQTMLEQQRQPEITGLAYLGERSRPAKNVEIKVFRFSEVPPADLGQRTSGVVTRRLRTDAMGRFDSGILQPGEYCLLAPLMDSQGQATGDRLLYKQLQSRPLYLTAGVGKSAVDLDLAADAQICLGVTGIPNSVTIGNQEVQVFVGLFSYTDGAANFQHLPVPPSDEPPSDGWPLPLPHLSQLVAGGMQTPPFAWWLPPRDYSVTIYIAFRSNRVIPGPNNFLTVPTPATKYKELALNLRPQSIAQVTLTLVGDSLEKRFEDAVKVFEKVVSGEIGPETDCTTILKSVADGLEFNVAVEMQEASVEQ